MDISIVVPTNIDELTIEYLEALGGLSESMSEKLYHIFQLQQDIKIAQPFKKFHTSIDRYEMVSFTITSVGFEIMAECTPDDETVRTYDYISFETFTNPNTEEMLKSELLDIKRENAKKIRVSLSQKVKEKVENERVEYERLKKKYG